MALGTNRDYKTADRRARKQLAIHFERMQALIAQGMSREDASSQAAKDMQALAQTKAERKAKAEVR